MRILLRPACGPAVPGGPDVGLGHVMRMAHLARALRRKGVEPFWSAESDEHADVMLRAFRTTAVDPSATGMMDAVVVDGASENDGDYRAMLFTVTGDPGGEPRERLKASRAVFIQAAEYSGADVFTLPPTLAYGGGAFILTDPSIWDQPAMQAADNHLRMPLISFGGSLLGRDIVVRLLGRLKAPLCVIWPKTYGEPPVVHPSVVLLRDPDYMGMRDAYRNASMVVGALGMTVWEALAAGVPGLFYGWTDAHMRGYGPLYRPSAVHIVSLASEFYLDGAMEEIDLLRGVTRMAPWTAGYAIRFLRARLGFDGQGVERVADTILGYIARGANQ